MGILNSIFGKKKQDLFTPFWSAFGRSYGCGNLRISNKIYSEITLKSLVGHICNAVETIEVWDANKTNENQLEAWGVKIARKIIKDNFREIFFDLYSKGYFVLLHNSDSTDIEYLPAKYTQVRADGSVYVEGGKMSEGTRAYLFYEKNYKVDGRTMEQVCKTTLDYIDNILNTASTGNARLGNLTILTPSSTPMGSEVLRDGEKKEIEKLISESYGGLDSQSNLMLFPNSLSTTTISFDFGKLQLFEQLKMEVMQLCDHFNIPYDILPISGQSTFNNQDNAYTMLYVTAERWVMMIQDAFKSLGVEFEFELKGKPNTEAQKLEQAKKDAVATMAQAVASGLMTIDEARKELEKYYEISKEKAL